MSGVLSMRVFATHIYSTLFIQEMQADGLESSIHQNHYSTRNVFRTDLQGSADD